MTGGHPPRTGCHAKCPGEPPFGLITLTRGHPRNAKQGRAASRLPTEQRAGMYHYQQAAILPRGHVRRFNPSYIHRVAFAWGLRTLHPRLATTAEDTQCNMAHETCAGCSLRTQRHQLHDRTSAYPSMLHAPGGPCSPFLPFPHCCRAFAARSNSSSPAAGSCHSTSKASPACCLRGTRPLSPWSTCRTWWCIGERHNPGKVVAMLHFV